MQHFDVIIIGAGAAGLMCAMEAGRRGRKVLVLDKAKKAGRKILISGGGRCNFTNLYAEPDAYLSRNPHFCKSALARYTQWDFIALMDKHGIGWHEKTLGQLFCDQRAGAVVDMLLQECGDAGVSFQFDCEIDRVERDEGFRVGSTCGAFGSQSLVIATGGPSIPRMGSTDFGLRIAKQFGLKTIPFRPALVPFTFRQEDLSGILKDLAGVAVEVIARCNEGQFREQVLFTHRGLSGPAALQVSSYWRKGDALHLNLLPDLDAENWLGEQRRQRPQALLHTVLAEKLPRRLAQRLCQGLFRDQPMQHFGNAELAGMGGTLNDWLLHPSGTEGMRTAEVALGGVDTDELSSKTLEAQKVPGLYFIGEVVDVTGWLGGYNFQWAWSSGWVAGQSV